LGQACFIFLEDRWGDWEYRGTLGNNKLKILKFDLTIILMHGNLYNLLLFEIVLRYDIFIFGDRKKNKNALDVDKIKKNT